VKEISTALAIFGLLLSGASCLTSAEGEGEGEGEGDRGAYCITVTLDSCDADPLCQPMSASAELADCITAERAVVACGPTPDDGCGDEIGCAIRPDDGIHFQFSTGCTPRGWERCEPCG
jgi:hypothetical protein